MTRNACWLAVGVATLPLLMAPVSHAQAASPAANSPFSGRVITKPDWLYRPTGQEANRVFPKKALREKIDGRVVLRCIVEDTGLMAECQVVAETPEGYGFGEAALKLSDLFIMRPKTIDGVPVGGGVVNIPIPFRLNPPPGPAQ